MKKNTKKRRLCRCKNVRWTTVVTDRSGRRRFARDYGIKAFRICDCHGR